MAKKTATQTETEQTADKVIEKAPAEAESAEDFDHTQTLLEGQEEVEAAEPTEPAPEPDQDAGQEPGGDEEEKAPTEAEEPTEPSFLDALRELGWEGENEQEAQQALLSSFKEQTEQYRRLQAQIEEQEELVRAGHQYLKEQREREEAEAKSKEPTSEESGPDPWWNPPQFDPTVLDQYRDVTVGPDGEPTIGWKKTTPPEIISAAEQYQQYVEQWATDLVQRPQEVLPKIIEQEFTRLFDERIAERDEAEQFTTFAQQVKAANEDWMYESDSQGRQVLTPAGQRMTELLASVAEDGVSDPRRQWEYAVAQYDYEVRQAQQASTIASDEAKETAAKKRKEHQQKGATGGVQQNRTGTVPRPDEDSLLPQDGTKTPGEQLLDRLRLDGVEL